MMRILKVTAICMKLLQAADSNQRTVIRAGDEDDDNADDGQTMVRAPIDDKKHKKMYKKIQIDNDDENATMVQAPAGKQAENIIESIIESGVNLGNLQVGNEHIELMKLRSPDVYQHTEEYPGDGCYCVISEKHLELLPGLERTYLDAGKEDCVVVKLERLFCSENPRKWLDRGILLRV